MPLNIMIVEDEPPIADYVDHCLRSILPANRIQSITIVHSVENAKAFIKKNKIDLCLLDLNLHGEDGFEVLKSSLSQQFHTIVISAHTDRALEAFEYGVIDFVPKNLKLDRLRLALDRFLGKESRPEETKYLIVRKNNKNYPIEIKKINYLKAVRYLVDVHLSDSSVEMIDKSLNQLEIILPSNFFRVHRSYIVCLDNVVSFEHSGGNVYHLKLKNGEILPVSRSRFNPLKQYFSGYSPQN